MSQIRMKLKIRMKLAANFLLKLGRSSHALSLVQHVEQHLASNCIVGLSNIITSTWINEEKPQAPYAGPEGGCHRREPQASISHMREPPHATKSGRWRMGGQVAGVLRLQLLLGDCMCALLLLSFGERCACVCVCA